MTFFALKKPRILHTINQTCIIIDSGNPFFNEHNADQLNVVCIFKYIIETMVSYKNFEM